VRLEVSNQGAAPMRYELHDTVPEWFDPLEPPDFAGTVAAGATAVHVYEGRVRFGSNASGQFHGVLSSDAGTVEQRALLERATLPLEVVMSPSTVRMGGSAMALLTLRNPASRPATLRLQAAVDAALVSEPLPDVVILAPKETLELPLAIEPAMPGNHRFEVAVFNGAYPVAFPAGADLRVLDPFAPQRTSSISLPFEVEAAGGDALLLRHEVAADASYALGSSTLSGVPIGDPLVRVEAERTFLYWRLPLVAEGALTYRVTHLGPLPQTALPALTLLAERLEIPLAGDLGSSEFGRANALEPTADGMFLEPAAGAIVRSSDQISVVVRAPYPNSVRVLVNDVAISQRNLGKAEFDELNGFQRLEYFGVELAPGRNSLVVETDGLREEIEVWLAGSPVALTLRPLSLVADGSTPLTVRIEALDANGIERGFGGVTIETDGEPLRPDAFPGEPGYQLLMREGQALLELAPQASVRRLRVDASFNGLSGSTELQLSGSGSLLAQAQGSVTASLRRSGVAFAGNLRAYLESPLLHGTVQAAVDSAAPLQEVPPANRRFPLTGASAEAGPALRSADGIAVRYDDERYSLGYYHEQFTIPAVDEKLEATALRGRASLPVPSGSLEVTGFMALLPSEQVVEEIRPDGTRLYRLERPVRPATERIELHVGTGDDREVELLRRSVDYVLDYAEGALALSSPLFPTDSDLRPVALVVTYAPAEAVRNQAAGGAGVSFEADELTLEAGVAHAGELRMGAVVGYHGPGTEVEAGFSYDDTAGSQLELSGSATEGPVEAVAGGRYRFREASLEVDARATVAFRSDTRALLRHRLGATVNETSALVEVDVEPFSLALGGGFDWSAGAPLTLAQAAWVYDRVTARLEQRNTLGPQAVSSTSLKTTALLLPGLGLEAGVGYDSDSGLAGAVELVQELGDANFSVGYSLPGSSGEGNRARFGVEAPLPIDEQWAIDFSAGYEDSLAGGSSEAAVGVGFRFRGDDVVATFASDVAFGIEGTKVVLRGGASGTVDENTVLSLDTTLQFTPVLEGTATVAHAYRDGIQSLLSYHRLTFGDNASIEGEVAHTIHTEASWQFRPAFAYRVPLTEPELALFQASLGGNVYPLPRVGIGGAVHQQLQPALDIAHTAFSVEAGYRLQPGIWINAGYTFGGFDGLTGDSRGFHLRLDALGGVQR
jgi:hypothetical protein